MDRKQRYRGTLWVGNKANIRMGRNLPYKMNYKSTKSLSIEENHTSQILHLIRIHAPSRYISLVKSIILNGFRTSSFLPKDTKKTFYIHNTEIKESSDVTCN